MAILCHFMSKYLYEICIFLTSLICNIFHHLQHILDLYVDACVCFPGSTSHPLKYLCNIYFRKGKWCSGKPKAVRERLNNDDSLWPNNPGANNRGRTLSVFCEKSQQKGLWEVVALFKPKNTDLNDILRLKLQRWNLEKGLR